MKKKTKERVELHRQANEAQPVKNVKPPAKKPRQSVKKGTSNSTGNN